MKNVIKLSCAFFVLGLLFIQIIPTTKPVTQEQKQEETIEVAEETETVKPSVADVEVKPTTEDVKVEDKQEIVKPKKKEEKKTEVVEEVEEVSEVTKLEKAEEIVKNTMAQGYEGSYSVSIEDVGIMVLLNVEEFTEYEQFNALDVDQAINKALRVNGYGDVLNATVVVDANTNEVYFTIANGQIL